MTPVFPVNKDSQLLLFLLLLRRVLGLSKEIRASTGGREKTGKRLNTIPGIRSSPSTVYLPGTTQLFSVAQK